MRVPAWLWFRRHDARVRRRAVVVWLTAPERACVVVAAGAALCAVVEIEREEDEAATLELPPTAIVDPLARVEAEPAASAAGAVAAALGDSACQKPPNITVVAASTAHRAGALRRWGFWRGARRKAVPAALEGRAEQPAEAGHAAGIVLERAVVGIIVPSIATHSLQWRVSSDSVNGAPEHR